MGFLILVLTSLLTFVLGYLRHCYNYWELQGVPQLRPHFIYGHFFKLKSLHLSELLQETYDAFKGKARLAGTYLFTRPIAVVTDLDLAKVILIKDFNKFVDRSSSASLNLQDNPLAGHLFNLHGEEWRALRTKLSPTFTSGKIKYMFSTITEVADQLQQTFDQEVGDDGAVLELHDLLGRYTIDVIGSCAFGVKCNSLKNPQAEFRVVGRKLFNNPKFNVRWALFRMTYANLFRKLPIKFKSFGQEHTKFFLRLVQDTVDLRERENIKRNDFMDLLLNLRKTGESSGLSVEQLAAQVFVFFVAGFETSSSNMSWALFELTKNQSIQAKLRDEILSVLQKHGKLTYEAMMEMTYLDQVVNETLRKYPALASLTRIPAEDYKLPSDDESNSDGHIVLERGIKVHIPVRAIHYDPEIYPEPHEFRPERFEPAATQQRHPLAFLGFGDGPRNCIGLRFGRMQVKVGLITLLAAFQFSQKGSEIPIVTNSHFVLVPKNGVKIRVDRLPADWWSDYKSRQV
ncbi:probable cytochrome P450 6a14 [Drosophila grimshawi]|uniref:GH10698 n=1 Tax=Drosophila grimshawi TaxID=7222 RepID=B4JC53_DROGR|nr:probable cytochrome P450 6a14 [Drosophila grimshawi]EDW03066.1 GH10698 [Drosophila grimshawi]